MHSLKSLQHLFFQLSLFILCFLFAFNFNIKDRLQGSFSLYYLVCLFVSWFLVLWLTHTHKPKFYQLRVKYVLSPFIKSTVSLLILTWVLAELFIDEQYLRQQSYLAILLYSIIVIATYFILTLLFNKKSTSNSPGGIKLINKYQQQELVIEKEYKPGPLDNNNLKRLEYFNSKVIIELYGSPYSQMPTSIKVYQGSSSQQLNKEFSEICIVDKRLNDITNLNSFLSFIYKSLIPGGYAFFVYEDLEAIEKKFIESTIQLIRSLKKICYYFYYRVLPEIPFLNKIFLLLSDGNNKVIPKTEVWGRLFFNGFDIKKQTLFNGLSFLLVRKELTPSENPNPSFYPIIMLNRIGLYGNIIKIHKVRSMYPYSEFLQKKVFEENNISSIGKFGNDFRITRLGKFYRKYWIDELPQFIDWFRGEIKLVGIRALSQHFFSLYSKEYQDLFIQVKPGIISPIFDDKTDGFSDIERIELKYLKSYLSHPVITDIKYFFITFKQIISGIRSN